MTPGLDLAACEHAQLAPGERAIVGTGVAVAIPDGYAGLVVPRSGLAARHGLTIVNAPGLIDSGYRGELKVILLNTDPREPFVVEPGMRIAQLVSGRGRVRAPGGGGGAARERARRRRLRLVGSGVERDVMRAEPRIRVSALLRWGGGVLLCRHEKRGKSVWLLPGGGVHSGETLMDALGREIREEVGIEPPPFEGPIALVDSIAPKGALVTKHVVHIIFAGDVNGSLESVTSQDEAVRGHRLFALDELDGVVLHPPIQRFLQRWQSGDPAVYLGALWTP